MPIELPGGPPVTYDDLIARARALIPALDPGWTDLNPGDPGIALVELFAWLTEMMAFQADQVPESHTRTFLALLGGGQGDGAVVARTVRGLRERYRAATAADYEHLVLEVWPGTDEARRLGRVARASCLPALDLTTGPAEAPGHVTLVVVPPDGDVPSPELVRALYDFLLPRRLLTTRHHVVGPGYRTVDVGADLAFRPDGVPDTTLRAAHEGLRAALDPLVRPFGRPVFESEVYAVLEGVPGVDHVENLVVGGGAFGPADLPRLGAVRFTGYGEDGRPYPYAGGAS